MLVSLVYSLGGDLEFETNGVIGTDDKFILIDTYKDALCEGQRFSVAKQIPKQAFASIADDLCSV